MLGLNTNIEFNEMKNTKDRRTLKDKGLVNMLFKKKDIIKLAGKWIETEKKKTS